MSLILLAAMMAQAPAAVEPVAPAVPTASTAKKEKPKQICELIEITGSRAKRRVCRDADGDLDLGPGVQSGSFGQDSDRKASAPGGAN
jgi:hypothetical protein